MKLSREVHSEIQTFFRLYFNDENLVLPDCDIFVRRGAWIFSKLFAINGITIGKRVFIKPALVKRSSDNRLMISKNLLVHELTHVMQYRRRGFFGFLTKYFGDYFSNLKREKDKSFDSRMNAYLNIPDEIEARDSADKFVEWLQSEKKQAIGKK